MLECDIAAELLTDLTVQKKAEAVIEDLKRHSKTLVLAESCTAGLVSGVLANIRGASAYLWGSYVCYTQEAKVLMLGLDNNELTEHGLVCKETACKMAAGALQNSGANLAAAVTGLAGPDGDGRVPVGTIWIATALKGGTIEADVYNFSGSRNEVRLRAVIAVLESIQKRLT